MLQFCGTKYQHEKGAPYKIKLGYALGEVISLQSCCHDADDYEFIIKLGTCINSDAPSS
jgi:hypothetical protein